MSQYPYLTLNEYYRERFGKKIAKIALDAGFTCPNRDGTLGTEGCIFCSAYGSGDYAQSRTLSISEQIEKGKEMIEKKWKDVGYIAYFQAFTNTYAPVSVLEKIYNEALTQPDVVGVSIATRPDCLGEDVLDLLEEISKKTALYVELGLQTANEETAVFIERGYANDVFVTAVNALHKRNIPVVVHLILGLTNETSCDILKSIDFINNLPIHGVKLQLLHVIEGTKLAELYKKGAYAPLTLEEYLLLLCEAVARLRPDMIVHRFTGDGKEDTLLAPLWSLKKINVLNGFHKKIKKESIFQGQTYQKRKEQ
ncbi:MAG: TIGR01212 family radical SAM protein [Bacillota bacterium]